MLDVAGLLDQIAFAVSTALMFIGLAVIAVVAIQWAMGR